MTTPPEVQRPSLGNKVTLFILDFTPIVPTADLVYFTPSVITGANVLFDGNSYSPFPVEAEGFEWTSEGTLPRPIFRLSNVAISGISYLSPITSFLIQYQDCVGAEVTRIMTLEKHLDTGSDPDPNITLGPNETWIIRRKRLANPEVVEFELGAAIDVQGRMLPGRQILRDSCGWTYRRWDASLNDFDYSDVEGCTYTGTSYFNKAGEIVTDPSLDNCGLRLNDCVKRFGTNTKLPFGAFPSAGKVR